MADTVRSREAAHAEADRHSRRRAVLRVALREGDVVSAARAGERLRVRDAGVTSAEASAARAARVAVGRAIRDARRRRENGIAHPIARAVPDSLRDRSLLVPRAAAAIGLVALLAFLVILFVPRSGEAPAAAPPEGETASATLEPITGRGRVTSTLPPVAAAPSLTPAPSTPAPSVEPAATAAPAPVRPVVPGAVPGGIPGGVVGGVPGGVIGGTGSSGAATPTPKPSPTINVVQGTPPPLALGAERFFFLVIDTDSGAPLANVCVVIGTRECGSSDYHTNTLGLFWLEVPPNGSRWGFSFFRDPDYWPTTLPPETFQPGMGTTPQLVYLRHK